MAPEPADAHRATLRQMLVFHQREVEAKRLRLDLARNQGNEGLVKRYEEATRKEDARVEALLFAIEHLPG